MAQVHRAPADRPEDALAPHLLFQTVVALVWKRLERSRLTDADRDDIAQNVAVRAFRRRATYRPSRGNVEQWLSGIVHNEICRFLEEQRRHVLSGLEGAPVDTTSEQPTPEQNVSLSELAEHAFAFLPPVERRAVILHEVDGHTLREVAVIEGISPATAFNRHKRGMARLREVVEEQKRTGVIPLPAALTAFFGIDAGGPGPSPEFLERAWSRALVELGLDDPPESEPPPSGTHARGMDRGTTEACDGEPQPSSSPPSGRPSSLGAFLGPLAGMLAGCLLVGPVLGHRFDPSRETLRATPLLGAAPLASSPALASVAMDRSLALPPPASMSPVVIASPDVPSPRATRATGGDRDDDRLGAERGLMDQARAALAMENVGAALDALAAHAQRFPGGQGAVMRERLWANACALHRHADPRSAMPEIDMRCTRR